MSALGSWSLPAVPATVEAVLEEIRFAYAEVNLLRRHLRLARVHPTSLRSAGDLLRIPPTSRALYRASDPRAGVARGAWRDRDCLVASLSTGTEGLGRACSWAHPATLAARIAALLDLDSDLKCALDSVAGPWAVRVAPRASSAIEWHDGLPPAKRRLPDGSLVLDLGDEAWRAPLDLIKRAAAEAATYPASWLYADPTYLLLLVAWGAGDAAFKSRIDVVIMTFSACLAAVWSRIMRAFSPWAHVAEVLSTSEMGWMGIRCKAGMIHLNGHDFLFEVLGLGDALPVPLGAVGELTVTTIGDRVMPRIRYTTGDLCSMERTCPCGWPMPAVRLHGRRADAIVRPDGGLVTARQVDDELGSADGLLLYQLEQRDVSAFVLHWLADTPLSRRLRANVVQRLRHLLGGNAAVEVRKGLGGARLRPGKFRAVASLAPPGDLG